MTRDPSGPVQRWTTPAFWLLLVAVGWLVILAATNWRDLGPVPVKTPPQVPGFSAEEAGRWLQEVFSPEEPHPAGSAAHAQVRQRILNLASGWGYQPETQVTELARRTGEAPTPLTNVMFRLKGSSPREDAVALVAHYDSVPTGPGIGDDASGVAIVLELARQFRQLPPARNDIIFLLTDGEELGLLGARQFLAEHSWAKDVRAVINLEARGTSGPSLMFQTGQPNRWLIELFAKSVSHPRTSSLFFEVYRYLPNDTDFTVFNRNGINGFNFAFIGDVVNYHTPNDNLKQLDRRSLQHQGDNALETLQALARADLNVQPEGNAVYFDLFGHWLIWWPVEWTLPCAGFLLLASILCSWYGPKNAEGGAAATTPVRLLWRWLADLLVIALALLITGGLGHLLAWDARLRFPWPTAAFSLLMTYWLVALAILLGFSRLLGPQGGTILRTPAVSFTWTLLAVLLAILLPGASYLFLIPAGLLVAVQVIAVFRPSLLSAGLVLAALGLGCLWIPNERLFYDALGFAFPIGVAIRPVFAGSFLLPWFGQLNSQAAWRIGLALVTAAVCFAVVGIAENRWAA